MNSSDSSLETLQDIRRIMERSSRFLSLSGLSGVSAGVCALGGAWLAHGWLSMHEAGNLGIRDLESRLLILALGVLTMALLSAFYFTWRKARKEHLPVWDRSSRVMLTNLLIPLVTGGLFVAALYVHSEWRFISPATLIFYGLALVNASKFTLSDIRYIGILDICLGLGGMYYAREGLVLWALGFGLLHIVYGMIMWWKYEWRAGTRES